MEDNQLPFLIYLFGYIVNVLCLVLAVVLGLCLSGSMTSAAVDRLPPEAHVNLISVGIDVFWIQKMGVLRPRFPAPQLNTLQPLYHPGHLHMERSV